ncbi:MAG: LuxR C-terminal-related transcriptional regulator, partial [bacterium]|nr:LuxR C-terminal-related transcriptional regulator [bacterium]
VVDGTDGADKSSIETLSDRELEVFERIGDGLTTREIAGKLGLSVKTIETHREHIKIKLRLRNSVELTRRAVQWVLEKK